MEASSTAEAEAVVKTFFTDDEWRDFPDTERYRYISIYTNHWKIKAMGLVNDLPTFMKRWDPPSKKRKRFCPPNKRTFKNDRNWTPQSEAKKYKQPFNDMSNFNIVSTKSSGKPKFEAKPSVVQPRPTHPMPPSVIDATSIVKSHQVVESSAKNDIFNPFETIQICSNILMEAAVPSTSAQNSSTSKIQEPMKAEAPLSVSQCDVAHLWHSIELEPDVKSKVKVKSFTPSRIKPADISAPQHSNLGQEAFPSNKENKLENKVPTSCLAIETPSIENSDPTNDDKSNLNDESLNIEERKQGRYPKRSVVPVSYAEDSLLMDDDFIFCEDCNQDYDGTCPFHPLILLRNVKVPRDGSVADRARKTAPFPLSIGFSKIKEAGRGVWTNAHLPSGLLFGPYEGRVLESVKGGEETGYGWKIRNKRRPLACIDAVNSSDSNWMRYVNCSRTLQETNLAAFQYKGEIYYKTTKTIKTGTELLVWYGDEFGEELGYKLEAKKGSGASFRSHSPRDSFECSKSIDGKDQNRTKCSQAKFPTFGCRLPPIQTEQMMIENQEETIYGGPAHRLIPTRISEQKTEQISHSTGEIICLGKLSSKIDKSYVCTECSYKSNLKCNLNRHCLIHTGVKPHQCTICDYRCIQKSSLKTHMLIHTEEKPHQCTVCDYRYSHKISLNYHMKTHTGVKPHHCTICDYRCIRKGDLNIHMKIHTGVKPHQCTICDFRCIQKGHLKTHMLIHSGEKPHQCTICDFRCIQKGHLKPHMLIHSGEKPHQCTICDFRCIHKGHLKPHMKIHTGVKPHQCTICDYRCIQKGDLNKHMKTHTRDSK